MTGARRPLLLLSGAAEGFGAELVRTFAGAGYDAVGLARSDRASMQLAGLAMENGGSYVHCGCDITQPEQVAAALQPYASSVSVIVHNAHRLLNAPFERTAVKDFEDAWRTACLGAMIVTQCVLPAMVARGAGTVILTGATASLRGGGNFSAFASAKFALRGLAQSLAREYGAKGIHVAHVIADGLIDEAQTERRFGPRRSGLMRPQAIAQTYLDLSEQHPSAWTHELDLRPSSEIF